MTTDLEIHCGQVMTSLKEAVVEALETKRRLGHYAVVIENGQPRRVPADQIESLIALAKEPR